MKPNKLSEAKIEELLQRITDGDSLATIVKGEQWPSYRSILRRIEADPEFRQRYDRARAVQAERWADEIVNMADEAIGKPQEVVSAIRNAIDARKWVASKLLPRKYGDRPTEVNVATQVNVCLVPIEKQREIQERTQKLLKDMRENGGT